MHFMDDLILIGAISIAALYTAATLAAAAAAIVVLELSHAVIAGEPFRAAGVLGFLILVCAAYDGAGLWLRKSGRI